MEHYEDDLIDASHSILTCIIDKTTCDYPDIQKYIKQITPITTLTQSSLFTGSNYSVNMMSELKKEILSSNEVRILVSFIRQSGVNLLLSELKRLTETGRKLKIITSTYMAATEYRAIRTLAQLPNTEVKYLIMVMLIAFMQRRIYFCAIQNSTRHISVRRISLKLH